MIEHYLQAFATVMLPQNILAMCLGGLWGLLAGALPGISTSMGVVPAAVLYLYPVAHNRLLHAGCRLLRRHYGRLHHVDPIRHPRRALVRADGDRGAFPGQAGPCRICPVGLSDLFDLRRDIQCHRDDGGDAPDRVLRPAVRPSGVLRPHRPGAERGFEPLGKIHGKGIPVLFLRPLPGDGGDGRHHGRGEVYLRHDDPAGGVSFVVAMVGLLAISEIFIEAEEPFKEFKGSVKYKSLRDEMPPWSLFRSQWANLVRSPIIGTVIGALPGAGATIAAFLAYGDGGPDVEESREIREGRRGRPDVRRVRQQRIDRRFHDDPAFPGIARQQHDRDDDRRLHDPRHAARAAFAPRVRTSSTGSSWPC